MQEWLELGRGFVELGFFGVAAFLLMERFITFKRRDQVYERMTTVVDRNSDAYLEHAKAMTHFQGVIEEQSRILSEVRRDLDVVQSVIIRAGGRK